MSDNAFRNNKNIFILITAVWKFLLSRVRVWRTTTLVWQRCYCVVLCFVLFGNGAVDGIVAVGGGTG